MAGTGEAANTNVNKLHDLCLFTFQDGSIENVFSTDLFPIHHLDEQEFFPGDFVMRNGTSYLTCTPLQKQGEDVYSMCTCISLCCRGLQRE